MYLSTMYLHVHVLVGLMGLLEKSLFTMATVHVSVYNVPVHVLVMFCRSYGTFRKETFQEFHDMDRRFR